MMMKSLVALACLAASTFAQNIAIGAPAEFTNITAGSNITVQVNKPVAQQASTDVAIVIALDTCVGHPNDECASYDVTQVLGPILYKGPFSPEEHNVEGQPWNPPYQNFTVTVPSTMRSGQASLTVSHFVLIGAGPEPWLEVKNMTMNVV
ncbi:hypothetical protein B0H21DRAFT_726143 [Amylocystis lapponica]|nr:hypothetical protein B0H21DRAFT_726143 [Amylocystis lapponica]